MHGSLDFLFHLFLLSLLFSLSEFPFLILNPSHDLFVFLLLLEVLFL
jgi:hypothetical protein